ncbi:MAG: FtsW/RodA/SpoVE family cell cycle protein [Lachnospiraceae bacterium]|nr:FtsW/RodA/SpoVE family cell cycle protein [Lachnospiraceae bacterium]
MFAFDKYKIRNFNLALLLCTAALCILGYMVLSSAVVNDVDGAETMQKQLMGMVGGGLLMAFLTLTDYHFWLRLHWVLYGGSLLILGLLFTPLGYTTKGATRWLNLPFMGRLQPSEFVKAAMIVFLAWFFQKYRDRINKPAVVFGVLGLFALPAVMIFLEPDLSTTLTFVVLFLIMLYMSQISYKWLGGMVASVIPVAGFLLWDSMQENPLILKRYMLNRVFSFLDPEAYAATGLTGQQDRAVMAIASGRLQGKGLFNASFDSVKAGNFLSEENCDFIFAVVGEELGFWGSAAILLLFALIVFLCFRTAVKAPDLAGRLLCVGSGAFLGLQVFFNVGVTSGILPNTGVVLPFFSHGISSLLSAFICLGLVMNVALQRRDAEGVEW